MRNFLKGKKMWRYVSGTYVIPKNTEEEDVVLIETWEANNAKIITWIHNSVEHSIGTQLAKYEKNKEGLGSSAKVNHAIKFYKLISIRE